MDVGQVTISPLKSIRQSRVAKSRSTWKLSFPAPEALLTISVTGSIVIDRYIAKLFIVGSTFIVCQCVAMKSCGDQLLCGRTGEQITRKWFDREPRFTKGQTLY